MLRGLLLYIGVLTVAVIGKSGWAIKCYQCSDCAEANALPQLDECSAITVVDASIDIASRIVKTTKPDASQDEIDMAIKQAKLANTLLDGQPSTCFKMSTKIQDEELVYRGCAPESDTFECVEVGPMITCACQGDGCNGAQTVLSSTVLACVCVFITLLRL